ncbi:sigma-70 family RNA polymerase sigma factor [Nocardiopsis flavescens]|uniref:RNA polymerase sigma factor n=1 Tax=Nocardiopsis flavescens TaxID=758803 RepID=A0A1M6UEF2_9ACTN|nr:sigma-70 family RNA polymerase sigma factor [Nocardiopsis flavescens]SHK67438.1 RNA polymerase sigma-70 factor, ECF subfamily [Nocardiopsis flavescens]
MTERPPGGTAGPSQDLLTALHAAHAGRLHRYVLRLTGDGPLTQDVVQETLLRAWRRPEVMAREEDAVRAWLYTVARNLVVDEMRSARRSRELPTDRPPEHPQADRSQAVLDAWLVADALSSLSAEHRAVVVGAYYRGRSAQELAAELDIPSGTVKSRLHYALRAMRLALQEKGVSP